MPRLRTAIIAASAAALSVPASAQATVPCTFDKDQKRVTVTFGGLDEYANIQRDGTLIRVDSAVCTDNGVDATINNTDAIHVDDPTNSSRKASINLYGGAFAPGATDEGDGDSEIELDFDMGAGTDEVSVVGDNINDSWTFGAIAGGTGANLNAGAEPGAGADVDVDMSGVNDLGVFPGDGNDTITGSSISPIYDGATSLPMEIDGGDHDDLIIGGSENDLIEGGTATDVLAGANGADDLRGDHGKDYMDGGPGIDEADYENYNGVTVDLRIDGYQQTGAAGEDRLTAIEDLAGSDGIDTLTGDNGENRIDGRNAQDTISGNGGDDTLVGGGGAAADTVSYADAPAGVVVQLTNAAPQNTQGAGTDDLSGFEYLTGSAFADELAGTNGVNFLNGGAGQDKVHGLGDVDAILIRDGEKDEADCGDGNDSIMTDAPGVDVLAGCEQVDALPAPPEQPPADDGNGNTPTVVPPVTPPGDGTQQPGGDTVPSGVPSGTPGGDRTKPVITGLKRRGRRLRLKLSENARISFAVRRGAAKKAKTINKSGVRGLNRVRLGKLRRGTYRVLVVATDEAGNRTTKKLTFRVRR